MNKEDDILVRISGQTHRLRPDQPESLRKIPWQQRKRLIEVLEAMKKAEYVDSAKDPKAVDQQQDQAQEQEQARPSKVKQAMAAETMAKPNSSQKPSQQASPSADSDAMMQRFLAEQQTHKSSIPTKASIYKWFLIVFAIILLLVIMF